MIHSKYCGTDLFLVTMYQILAYAVQTYHSQSEMFQLAMYLLGPKRLRELHLTVK